MCAVPSRYGFLSAQRTSPEGGLGHALRGHGWAARVAAHAFPLRALASGHTHPGMQREPVRARHAVLLWRPGWQRPQHELFNRTGPTDFGL